MFIIKTYRTVEVESDVPAFVTDEEALAKEIFIDAWSEDDWEETQQATTVTPLPERFCKTMAEWLTCLAESHEQGRGQIISADDPRTRRVGFSDDVGCYTFALTSLRENLKGTPDEDLQAAYTRLSSTSEILRAAIRTAPGRTWFLTNPSEPYVAVKDKWGEEVCPDYTGMVLEHDSEGARLFDEALAEDPCYFSASPLVSRIQEQLANIVDLSAEAYQESPTMLGKPSNLAFQCPERLKIASQVVKGEYKGTPFSRGGWVYRGEWVPGADEAEHLKALFGPVDSRNQDVSKNS